LFHIETNSLYQLFNQVIRLHFQRVHSTLEPLGLYPGQPPVLFVLAHKGGLKQRELADHLHIQPATLTVMLKRMEASGYITRRPDPMDLRVSRVFLTEEGKELCQQVRKAFANMEQEYFGALTPEDKEKMREGLTLVRDRLLKDGGEEVGGKPFDCE
jgi:MarR family transcriptional regulator, organic hydroperoxide resistance regulator